VKSVCESKNHYSFGAAAICLLHVRGVLQGSLPDWSIYCHSCVCNGIINSYVWYIMYMAKDLFYIQLV
jgi:hypothetical protein